MAFVLITTSSFHLSMEGICVSWAHLCIFAQMRHQRYCLDYLGIAYHHRGLRLKYLKQLTVTSQKFPMGQQRVYIYVEFTEVKLTQAEKINPNLSLCLQ